METITRVHGGYFVLRNAGILFLVCLPLRIPRIFLQLLSFEEPWTLILDDALANSFIAPVTDDMKDDHQLTCKFS